MLSPFTVLKASNLVLVTPPFKTVFAMESDMRNRGHKDAKASALT